MQKIKSLDLFCGIGGFTLALHDLMEPVVYCDCSPASKTIISHHVNQRNLPAAKWWVDDVKCLRRSNYPVDVDIIVGGFPCVGFSSAGNCQGFEDSQSALFFELIRVIGEYKPPMVFMENVPFVLTSFGTVHAELDKLGYDLTWCVLPCQVIGAPHFRKRWFCLARSRETFDPSRVPKITLGDLNIWKNRSHTDFSKTSPDRTHLHRVSMLGNALVPAVARLAFFLLARNFRPMDLQNPSEVLTFQPVRDDGTEMYGATHIDRTGCFGYTKGSRVFFLPLKKQFDQLAKKVQPPLNIRLCSTNYTTSKEQKNVLEVLDHINKRYWATPRHHNPHGANILTYRTARDLGTQCKFCDEPGVAKYPYPNAEFVEWMMGFPKDWTKV